MGRIRHRPCGWLIIGANRPPRRIVAFDGEVAPLKTSGKNRRRGAGARSTRRSSGINHELTAWCFHIRAESDRCAEISQIGSDGRASLSSQWTRSAAASAFCNADVQRTVSLADNKDLELRELASPPELISVNLSGRDKSDSRCWIYPETICTALKRLFLQASLTQRHLRSQPSTSFFWSFILPASLAGVQDGGMCSDRGRSSVNDAMDWEGRIPRPA